MFYWLIVQKINVEIAVILILNKKLKKKEKEIDAICMDRMTMQIIVGIKNDYKWFKFVYSMQPNNQKKKKKIGNSNRNTHFFML